jgi:putative MATE family efflux protein
MVGVGLFRGTWRRVLDIAWPVIATGSIRTTMRTVDVLIIGVFVGPAAVAAVGIADVIARIVLMIALGLGAGTIALVSQAYGADRQRYADAVTTQTVVLALLLGVPITIVGWLIAPSFFAVLGAERAVAEPGALYLRVIILTAAFRILSILSGRALAGAGDTRTPMVVNVGATALNIVLTVTLVAGVGPVASYGVLGAAVGTAVGNVLAGVAFLGIFASGLFRVSFRPEAISQMGISREIIRIGTPQVLDRNLYVVADIPLNWIILLFGTEVNAAFQIGRRVQQYARMPNWGFSTASSTLVGNNLGDGNPRASERFGWGSVSLAVVVTGGVGATLFVFAEPIAGIFTSDAETFLAATDWIRVLAIATVFQSVFSVVRGGLQGAGDTKWPLYATLVGISGFTLGFSYVVGVALDVGILGVYLGVTLDYVARSAIVAYRFEGGSWKDLETDVRSAGD